MKKTSFFLASCFIFVTVHAQVSLGPRAGFNPSTLTGEGNDKKYLPGFNAGLVLNVGVSNIFSVQPELSFSKQGYRVESEDNQFYIEDSFNYINMPVLAKATFGRESVKGYVNLGPYAGYMVGGRSTVGFGGQEFSDNLDFEQQEHINRFDFGIASGAGIMFDTGAGNMMLDARYSMGLTPVSDKTVFEEGKDANSVFAVTVGYLFPLGIR